MKRKNAKLIKRQFYSSGIRGLRYRQGKTRTMNFIFPGREVQNWSKRVMLLLVCARDPCLLRNKPNLIVRPQSVEKSPLYSGEL